MKVSLNWLKEYVDLSGIPVSEIIHNLTMSGLEVEEVINQNEIYKNFVVGFVKEKIKHPNADKLSVCKVSNGTEEMQVVCGAPNVEAGQKIVFAQIGAIVPNGNFKITKAKIRGTESFGMICSESELEISSNHEGIMVLSSELKEGTPISEALGLDDVLLEIAITPNRSDALSHFGVARDLSAIFDRKLKLPEINLEEYENGIKDFASVEILDPINCPRYSAKVVKDVIVKESPDWLKQAVQKIGMRPINNIVDVTNYIMYETGQPLHAFDLKMLKGNKIVVQSTTVESQFTTLDSKVRKLPANTLLICDAEKPVAVAGVMGGENSEVTSDTKNILIESAYFNPSSIRRTAKALGLSTDASYRFERTTNAGGTIYAAERAAQLIAELSGGKVAQGTIDVYPEEVKQSLVSVRFARVEKILGYYVEPEKIRKIVLALGFEITFENDEQISVRVPLFRPDVEREIDVIEEIARINGYDNIPTISSFSVPLGVKHDESSFYDKVRDTAVGLGFYEMINNPLQNEKTAALTGNQIGVLNPQSLDMAYLRTSLVPGALMVAAKNFNVGEKNLALFEIGNVFNKNSEETEIKSFSDFKEETKIIFLLSGKASLKEWHGRDKNYSFYYLKGLINSFLNNFTLDNVLNDSYYHSGNRIFDFIFAKEHDGNLIGNGGRINKEVLNYFNLQQEVFCFELDLNLLEKLSTQKSKYNPLLKYPKMMRDFAFIFDKEIEYEDVAEFIKKNGGSLLQFVRIFDLFESESLGVNKKSMAFELEYFNENRTLKDEEVEKDFNNLITLVSNKFNAKLRGN